MKSSPMGVPVTHQRYVACNRAAEQGTDEKNIQGNGGLSSNATARNSPTRYRQSSIQLHTDRASECAPMRALAVTLLLTNCASSSTQRCQCTFSNGVCGILHTATQRLQNKSKSSTTNRRGTSEPALRRKRCKRSEYKLTGNVCRCGSHT